MVHASGHCSPHDQISEFLWAEAGEPSKSCLAHAPLHFDVSGSPTPHMYLSSPPRLLAVLDMPIDLVQQIFRSVAHQWIEALACGRREAWAVLGIAN